MSQTIPKNDAIISAPSAPPATVNERESIPPSTTDGGRSGLPLLAFLFPFWFAARGVGGGRDEQESERVEMEAAITRRRRQGGPVRQVLMSLASLRLTVVLFSLSMILVFVGTLAQKDAGIWTVVGKYFRSFFVWVPFQVFFPGKMEVGGGFPFVGGWFIGTALLINVVAAHIVRFRYTIKRVGIVLTHAGIITLMAGELVTGVAAVEGNMTIRGGGYANFTEIRDKTELAFIGPSDDPKKEHQIVIPENVLRSRGRIKNAELPFDVEVVKYMTNSKRTESTPDNPATIGYGLNTLLVEQPEVSGADPDQTRDLASAYVRLYKKGTDEEVGTYAVSIWFSAVPDKQPQTATAGDKTYDLSLRFKRSYKPYTVKLLQFHHDVYPGTKTPKNFSSEIELIDPSRGVDRTTVISMNNPLRYQGETFFQASFLEGDEGTILQVVRNPGWLLPYISCTLVSIGLLVHFGTYLVEFLRRRAA
jgi:hypothetical protein